jgi:hypothetical protein
MSTTFVESRPATAATYGGLLDAIGGIATAVIAIVGLTGFHPEVMAAIATIVFGAALLIEGGTLLTEYVAVMPALGAGAAAETGDGGISLMFLAGVGGIVLGILALLGIAAPVLTSVSVIAFGAALLLSSGSLKHLFRMQAAARGAMARSGTDIVAGEMASGSSGVHLLTGIAAIVLGILSVAGARPGILTLTSLLIIGVGFIVSGSSLTGLMMSFMRQHEPARSTRPAL